MPMSPNPRAEPKKALPVSLDRQSAPETLVVVKLVFAGAQTSPAGRPYQVYGDRDTTTCTILRSSRPWSLTGNPW